MTIVIANAHNTDLFKAIDTKHFTSKEVAAIIKTYINNKDFQVDFIDD
jgi:hypothetical protein